MVPICLRHFNQEELVNSTYLGFSSWLQFFVLPPSSLEPYGLPPPFPLVLLGSAPVALAFLSLRRQQAAGLVAPPLPALFWSWPLKQHFALVVEVAAEAVQKVGAEAVQKVAAEAAGMACQFPSSDP